MVAIGTEQGFAGLVLQLPFVGLGITLLEIDLAVPDPEHGDHAVAVEELVIIEDRRELIVGVNAMEGPIKLGGNVPVDLDVQNVALQSQRPQRAGKPERRWKMGHAPLLF